MSVAALPAGWAAALLAAIAAIVVGLYLLRPPPRRITVASNLVWARVLGRGRRDPERWRWWLALALSLAIALAVAAALLGPESADPGGAGGRVAIVIDTASTMATWRSDGRTRLEHAVEAAQALVRSAGASSRFLVVDTMRILGAGAFGDAAAALARLGELTDVAVGHPRFPDIAQLDPAGAPPAVVFFTDGVSRVQAPPDAQVVSVFEAAPNVGITAFEVRERSTDARRRDAFIALDNAGAGPVTATVSLSGPGRAAVTRVVDLPARGSASVTLPASDFAGGPLRAAVRADGDSFALDDVAFAFAPLTTTVRVALVTTGNAALERALRLDPRLRVTVVSPENYAARAGFGAYVLDRFAPAVPPAAPALLFRPSGVSWLPVGPVRREPVVDAWLDGHPVLDNVSLRDAQVAASLTFRDAPGETVALARTQDGAALIVAIDTPPRRVAVGFSLDESGFAYQASFPMFVSNALAWLTREPPVVPVRLGTVRIPLERARVSGVDVAAWDTRFVPGATLVHVQRPDVLSAESEHGRVRVVANLLDRAVTDVNATALEPQPAAPAARSAVRISTPPWIVLLLLAIGLMVLEWWTYHRRVTA